MSGVLADRVAEAREIERRLCQGTDEIVRSEFPAVAKLLWPHKTAACLASIAKCEERSAWRWLSGEHEPPISIVLAVNQKIWGFYVRK